jgi:hypothetical protein
MTVKALPGPSLEVVKTEFFFHLLVSLLADPTRLDGGPTRRAATRVRGSPVRTGSRRHNLQHQCIQSKQFAACF